MKIANSRIFIADVHHVDFRGFNIDVSFGDFAVGNSYFETSQVQKDVVLVAFKTKNSGTQYVPISYLKNMISYLSVKLASKFDVYNDKRFISDNSLFAGENQLFLEDLQNLFDVEGKTELKDLKDIQARHNEDNQIVGTL